MDKIWLIIQREYLTRVRKKSFLVISLLAPVLLAASSIAIGKLSGGRPLTWWPYRMKAACACCRAW